MQNYYSKPVFVMINNDIEVTRRYIAKNLMDKKQFFKSFQLLKVENTSLKLKKEINKN